jgi:hypothetical protein
LLFEKPQNYAKLQLHNREINKLDPAGAAPERFHSSKLLQEKLIPSEPVPREPMKMPPAKEL